MKTVRSLCLLFALALSLTVCGQTSATRVETVQFKSTLVGKTLPYSVVLPDFYPKRGNEKERYPVLYLLHGLDGHYSNFLTKTKLTEYAAQYKIVIITPEGNDGWYTDSATIPTDKYESYLINELIPEVDSRYRTIAAREGRAIAGISMGGYGSLKFGLKHPEVFVFAGSISGALDPAVRTDERRGNAWGFLRPSIMQTFGPAGSPTRAENDLHKLAREFPADRIPSLPFFYLDCGTEDGFLPGSRDLATILLERKIPLEFRQLPGTHSWTFWDAQVQEVLRRVARVVGSRQ